MTCLFSCTRNLDLRIITTRNTYARRLPALMHTQPCARNLPAACPNLSLISSQGDDDNADDDDLDDVDDQGHRLNEQIK